MAENPELAIGLRPKFPPLSRVPLALISSGTRVGSLVAVQRTPSGYRWVWRCDCGRTIEKQGAAVRRWFIQSGGASCPACYFAPPRAEAAA